MMSKLTLVALFWLVFNSLWLAHVFVVLALGYDYVITEPFWWVAAFEAVLCLSMAGLGIERMFRMRE